MGPPALFMHLIICSSTNSIQAKSIPFWTRSRTASAAFSTVGKEDTATEVGRTGWSFSVAVESEGPIVSQRVPVNK